MKKIWKGWLLKIKRGSTPEASTTVEPVVSTTVETLCTTPAGNADEGFLSKQQVSTIEPELASNIDIASVIANRKCITAKLINTNKRDLMGNPRYENLDFVNKGDIVTLGYMDEPKTYLVLDTMSNELGEISSPVSSTILKCNESSIIAIVDNIAESDQGKRIVSINVYA
ncbi:MAG: hypothetical protein CVU91_08505 [Firmicutes bacterium HGW-Firmicutes-16]|nr:MAG: hypothetical protein CVU91_08505 [Firmicutes bacterium HGW-Firmicutes-16]